MVVQGRVEVVGDDSPNEQTVVYDIAEYICRNEKCLKHNRLIGEERNQIYPTQGGDTA